MRWLSFAPGKSTLVLLFMAAKRRVIEQTDGVADLSDERISSATEELNRIADDVRAARTVGHTPASVASTNPAPGFAAERRREPRGRRHGDH